MPITDVVVVSVITLAFVVFAVVLAWGDQQTRDIARASRARALSGAGADSPKHPARSESVGRAATQTNKAPAHA